jgi:uncharacterized phage infection (PIP) family protein YhgE
MSLIQEIADLEQQEQTATDAAHLNIIRNQLKAKKVELEQQQSAKELEQKESEHSDKLLDIANQIYEALFPRDKYTSLLGLNTYEEKQQGFNQLYHAAINEHTQPLIDSFKDEIAKRDEKIKALNEQGMETENQLAEAKKQLQDALRDRDDALQAHQALDEELTALKATRAQKDADAIKMAAQITQLEAQVEKGNAAQLENVQLRQQIVDLEAKLEQAQKPAAKPSAAFSELLEQTKKASEMLDAKVQRGLDRWSQLLPEIVPPPVSPVTQETPFRGDDQTEAGAAELADNETPELPAVGQVTEEQFPASSENVAGSDMVQPDAGSETSPADDAPVSRSEFDSLVKRVEELERPSYILVNGEWKEIKKLKTEEGAA